MLGDKAMKKMAGSNVLLVGLGGLGVEIGKFVRFYFPNESVFSTVCLNAG